MKAVLVSGSPSATSRSRGLLDHARGRLEAAGLSTTTIDLASLPADGLLGRTKDPAVTAAVESTVSADIVVASSPTYRATYTGLLKTFFDLLPQDALAGKTGLPILTGGGPAHQLALDHAFRPLFASLGATVVTGVYAFDAQLKTGIDPAVTHALDASVDAAVALARAAR